jgi:hypothetical protein
MVSSGEGASGATPAPGGGPMKPANDQAQHVESRDGEERHREPKIDGILSHG